MEVEGSGHYLRAVNDGARTVPLLRFHTLSKLYFIFDRFVVVKRYDAQEFASFQRPDFSGFWNSFAVVLSVTQLWGPGVDMFTKKELFLTSFMKVILKK